MYSATKFVLVSQIEHIFFFPCYAYPRSNHSMKLTGAATVLVATVAVSSTAVLGTSIDADVLETRGSKCKARKSPERSLL